MRSMKSLVVIILMVLAIQLQAKETSLIATSPSLNQVTEELLKYLQLIYKNEKFSMVDELPQTGDLIVLTTDTTFEREEFKVCSTKNNNKQVILTISGGSPVAEKYGIYQFLEELGCGFYLSYEILPETNSESDWEGINFSDKPLTSNRLVFNWHNFLSGCSSWNFEEWKQYIDRASKMRFNGLMTHFYANDPSFTFSHNGVKKAAGYMPNTKAGRQYGTQQVNDVTRMVAGSIFEYPVFGSDASEVPDNKREKAAQELVKNIHSYAVSKSMKIWMGFDIDYPLANPPEIMAILPKHAKINIERKPDKYSGMPDSDIFLPVPDSREGYAYYKSQISQLFILYPEINNLVLWTRSDGSAFLTLRYDEFPEKWKREFANRNQKFKRRMPHKWINV